MGQKDFSDNERLLLHGDVRFLSFRLPCIHYFDGSVRVVFAAARRRILNAETNGFSFFPRLLEVLCQNYFGPDSI